MITVVSTSESDEQFVYRCICELEQTAFDPNAFSELYKQNLVCGYVHGFVLKYDGEPVGYMGIHIQNLLHHCGKVAEIQELVVLPGHRGKKIGEAAVDFAKAFARDQNCVMLELASSNRRTDAHRFYARQGFRQSHVKFTFDTNTII